MAQITMLDVIKHQYPDGTILKLVDPTKIEQAAFLNMPAVVCNNKKVHSGEVVVVKATASEYAYGLGTAPTKEIREVVTDITSGVESTCEMDIRIIENEKDGAERYASEEQSRFNVMFETASARLFNGNPATDPLQIRGLYNRSQYNTIGTYVYDNAKGNATATPNKTSLWGIQQGEKMCHLIYPDVAGKVVRRDFTPKFEKTDDAGNTFPCQKTRWNLDFGLFVHDYRCVFRVANISCSATPDGTTEVAFDEDLAIKAILTMPESGKGCVLYANNALIIQMTQRANKMPSTFCNFTPGAEMGFPVPGKILSFFNKPVLREDTITIVEGKIS